MRFLVGPSSFLSGTKVFCMGHHKHFLLRGRGDGTRASMTKLAQPYPEKLCAQLAQAVCLQLGRFNGPLSLACRCNHRRIGEAKNPGPLRRKRMPEPKDAADLDRVELIRPETLALGRDQWQKILVWAQEVLGESACASLWAVPGLMVALLGAYGRHWYSVGGSLFN